MMGNRQTTDNRKSSASPAAAATTDDVKPRQDGDRKPSQPEANKKGRGRRGRGRKVTDVMSGRPSELRGPLHPELITTTTLETADEEGRGGTEGRRLLQLTIYRSYSNAGSNGSAASHAATAGSSLDPDISDVKIYKRSKDGIAPIVGRADSTGTLGNSSGGRHSRSPASGRGSLAASTAKDYPELVRRQLRWDSFSDTKSSARVSATSSPATTSYKGEVNKADFPDTATVKDRLRRFEDYFVSMFIASFTSLPVRLRAAVVSLAVRRPEAETTTDYAVTTSPSAVSLYQYFRCPPPVAAAIEARRDYVITVPETVMRDAMTARRCGTSEAEDDGKTTSKMGSGSSVARDAAAAAAKMAADELSRMFEYQLVLLAEDAAIKMVAGHAVECVIDYVIAGRRTVARLLDRNTIVQGHRRPIVIVDYVQVGTKLVFASTYNDDATKLAQLKQQKSP